jgi:hypothetical protein
LWTRWQLLRFRLAKPQQIGAPPPNAGRLSVVPLGRVDDRIPLREVMTVEHIPEDEAPLGMRILINAGLLLAKLVPANRPGWREIDADPHRALDDADISSYARVFRAPVRPSVYDEPGALDLGRLAVEGPYALFLERGADGQLQWDFRQLGEFEHHDGLCSLGLRVVFDGPDDSGRLSTARIESTELGVVGADADHADWERATALAICAAGTHLSLTRHFNFVHLVSGNHWDVATRNGLPTDHPLYRLLWPHVFNSFYTNYGVTRVQMLPDGDFANMFSYTHPGLMAYYDEMYRTYDITVTDPVADWQRRGLDDEDLDSPTRTNLVELFDVMHAHTSRYVDAYYESDEALCADPAVVAWLGELAALIPNGIGGVDTEPTKAAVARLVAGYISEGSTIHDLVGTTMWDYQLWSDRNPVRVYRDGRRVPVDVFQRVLNNNFALQIRRAQLLADYGQVALDERGRTLFTRFHDECRSLQERYGRSPAGPWRMEPQNLEINMNG